MKRKELKTLAKKIAAAEQKYQNATDDSEKSLIEKEIMKLSSQVHSIEEMEKIDDMVREILNS
jgi:hypothetical protein